MCLWKQAAGEMKAGNGRLTLITTNHQMNQDLDKTIITTLHKSAGPSFSITQVRFVSVCITCRVGYRLNFINSDSDSAYLFCLLQIFSFDSNIVKRKKSNV